MQECEWHQAGETSNSDGGDSYKSSKSQKGTMSQNSSDDADTVSGKHCNSPRCEFLWRHGNGNVMSLLLAHDSLVLIRLPWLLCPAILLAC